MFTHICVSAQNLETSKKFYDAALGALGVAQIFTYGSGALTLFQFGFSSTTRFDGLRQRALVFSVEQGNFADVIEVKTDGVRHEGCFLGDDNTSSPVRGNW